MKKILLSLGTLVVVGAIVAGATIAFYNDTETSNGNIFVAGSIDLKVDHTAQTYNGVDCKTCNVTVVSDTSNQVTATTGGSDPVAFPHSAKLVVMTPITTTYWTATIPGASWIWATDPVTQNDVDNDVTYTFEKTFNWVGPISGATINLGVAADNSYEVFLNNTSVGADTNENNHAVVDQIVSIDDNIVQGTNTLKIVVKNWKLPGAPLENNPGGLKYKLTINGNCGDAYFQNHCELWQSTDLDGSQQFFNFGDVKPGDQGTDVISLNVTSNDAYACLLLNNKKDNENTLVDPEVTAGDSTPGVPAGTDGGELSNYLNVVVWDENGVSDGIHQPAESILYNGLLKNLVPLSLSLLTSTTDYLGLAWCAGTQTVAGDGSISCSGSGNQNVAQTDSFLADAVAYAVQQRNNPGFLCSSVVLPSN